MDQQGCAGYHQEDWTCAYNVNPYFDTWTPAQVALLRGGETAMWGEGINQWNGDAFMFRTTTAVAERLWSQYGPQTINNEAANDRLVEALCRIEMLGVRAGPIQPSFCPGDVASSASTRGNTQKSAASRVHNAMRNALGSGSGRQGDSVTVTLSRADAAIVAEMLAKLEG